MVSSSSSQSTSTRRKCSMVPSFYCTVVVFISLILLAIPSGAYQPINRFVRTQRSLQLDALTIMAPADLTPAIDKFVRLPTGPNIDPYFMTAKGPVPEGPEPFQLVASELQPLSDYVKEMVVSENPVLTMAASHFFEKVKMITVNISTLIASSISLITRIYSSSHHSTHIYLVI